MCLPTSNLKKTWFLFCENVKIDNIVSIMVKQCKALRFQKPTFSSELSKKSPFQKTTSG